MTWNKPGNNGDKSKNTWFNHNDKNASTPPDLDEILKSIVKKLRSLFGGNSSQDGNNNMIIVTILIVCFALYFLSGFFTVYPYEQAVVTRFGKYDKTLTDGLHWRPSLIDKIIKVKTENVKSSNHEGWILTKDENILFVEIEVQYRVFDAEKYLFQVIKPDEALKQAAESALRQVIGESMTDDVLTEKKMQIANSIKDQLEKTLAIYNVGLYVQTINFKNSRPPEPVKDSFDDVTRSREDKERSKLQADAYANKILPEAEGIARKMLLEAEAVKEQMILKAKGEAAKFDLMVENYKKAPAVTRQRLYLETMEQVMKNTTKVLVDSDKGNNLIYLPLDKIMENNNPSIRADERIEEFKHNQNQVLPAKNINNMDSKRVNR